MRSILICHYKFLIYVMLNMDYQSEFIQKRGMHGESLDSNEHKHL